MRARYYNVDIKRFINQDVVEGSITNSPSLNKYAYCQGNPVSLLDPFGLSPQGSSSFGWHLLLDALGFVPVVGIFADIVNGAWYLAEGDYAAAIGSFIAAVPMIGDTIGIFTTAITGCTKMSKMIGYGTRLFSRIGNMALGVYNITNTICNLYDKHHNQKLDWDKDSTFQLATSLLSVELLTIDAIDFAHGLSNFDAIKYDIETSQCFVAGTLVLTSEGNKPIEEIKAGDLVYSTNPETGESEYKEVVRAFRKESDVIIHIFVNGEEIETTPQHPFWVEDEWVSAKDLREGDVLTLADGTSVAITRTYGEQLDEPVIVYNFEVQDFHTYYVTDTGVLVHNADNYSFNDEEDSSKSRNKPKTKGTPSSVEIQRDSDGNIIKYTEFDENGNLVKEVRLTGKEHGNIPRPNVKEPVYNTNPKTGERFHNGYSVRTAEPWEIP